MPGSRVTNLSAVRDVVVFPQTDLCFTDEETGGGEVTSLAQDHPGSKWQSQDSNLHHLFALFPNKQGVLAFEAC